MEILLDTEKDINRRKILAIAAYNTLKNISNNKYNSIQIKVRPFNAYIASTTVKYGHCQRTWKTPSTPSNAENLETSSEYTGPKPSAMKNFTRERRPNPGIPVHCRKMTPELARASDAPS